MKHTPELLAPAGTMEKLKFALAYGADAVYIGIQGLSLRAGAGNFAPEEVAAASDMAHNAGARIYAAINIFARDEDIEKVRQALPQLKTAGLDALIIADPGVLSLVQEKWPQARIHISTQANILNSAAAAYWHSQGAARVTLARELSLSQIRSIGVGTTGEVEVFVHGAMCMGYSGRCYLSKYMTGRDSNLGDCAHACRWKYHLMEEQRPGMYYPVETDGNHYFFNSSDLCLARRLPELMSAGIRSFKIEGRMKSLHYLATVTGVYRRLIDDIGRQGSAYEPPESLIAELYKVSHRGYTEGFIDGEWLPDSHSTASSGYRRDYDFVGIVNEPAEVTKRAVVGVRNKISVGDEIEVVRPGMATMALRLEKMWSGGAPVGDAHANAIVELELPAEVGKLSIIRRPSASRVTEAVG